MTCLKCLVSKIITALTCVFYMLLSLLHIRDYKRRHLDLNIVSESLAPYAYSRNELSDTKETALHTRGKLVEHK